MEELFSGINTEESIFNHNEGHGLDSSRKISDFIRDDRCGIAMSFRSRMRGIFLEYDSRNLKPNHYRQHRFSPKGKGWESFLWKPICQDLSRSIEFGYGLWKRRGITAKLRDSEISSANILYSGFP